MPSGIDRTITRLRSELSDAESFQRGRMVEAYQRAIARVEAQLWTYLREMEAFPNIGPTYQQMRLEQLLESVRREYNIFVTQAEPLLRDAQQLAAQRGIASAQQIVSQMAPKGGFSGKLNRPAFERAVSAFGPGTPLHDVLQSHGTLAAKTIEQGIVEGIATGQGTQAVQRAIQDQLEAPVNRVRLEATVRTEMMRAYRGAQVDAFMDVAGQDIIGWRWVAHKSNRTCMACIAMSQRLYPVDHPPAKQHPQCRCVIRPELDPEIIGGPSDIETGADWFGREEPDTQLRMIGNGETFAAWQAGKVRLRDMVRERHDDIWGTSVGVRSWPDIARLRKLPLETDAGARATERLVALQPKPTVSSTRPYQRGDIELERRAQEARYGPSVRKTAQDDPELGPVRGTYQ